MKLKISISLLFCSLLTFAQFNVISFGAKGDGISLDTKAIQAAVDEASVKGGVVLFPAGNYLTGTIYLKDNV